MVPMNAPQQDLGRHVLHRPVLEWYAEHARDLPWRRPEEGTPIALADYRDVVLVAGRDPYGWKGLEDVAVPGVRPSGEGGCSKDG